jgi:hypothetical protein
MLIRSDVIPHPPSPSLGKLYRMRGYRPGFFGVAGL